MRGAKVTPGPCRASVLRSHYSIKHHRGLAVVSLLLSASLVAMPFQAYISETLPWTTALPASPDFNNLTIFNQTALATHQALYSHATLPHGATYVFDIARNAHVCRHVLSSSSRSPLSLPGVLFYGRAMVDLLQSFANDSASGAWHQRGTCTLVRFITVPLSHQCIWLSRDNPLDSAEYTLTYVLTQYPYPALIWFKFFWRIGSTVLLLTLLWRRYFGPLMGLAHTLAVRGHRNDLIPEHTWRYELIAGDPTAPLLVDPFVVGAFFVDFTLSPHMVAVAVLRLLQVRDVGALCKAVLYLFRMIWFACFSLVAVNKLLKRCRLEYVFTEVDPMWLGLAVLVLGPLLWVINVAVPSFLNAYRYLLVCVYTTNDLVQIEVAGAGAVYILIIAVIPLCFGLRPTPFCRRRRARRVRYSSFLYNSTKNRILFSLVPALRGDDNKNLGGSIYLLFRRCARAKALPVVNTRGPTATFSATATTNDRIVEIVPGASAYCFNHLVIPDHNAAVDQKTFRPQLLCPLHASPWCM
ncbi:hypothetical protein SPRG_15478 [Saprolegnia parasitica CBS 223.65]|uniref:Uncharacterized protein n=1 Tax=Saprolegnia parasitica (strain CBS 223.65) TaxID=695850 RepID=A0A067BVG4_SAPPC|nr:hypothetical protein SPRG_15478 [Saprolegnia parasitica CBS 223.65]KDO18271.1 hypothetical protein SPRG_15478 [Saprolegnia parasitica CBS 223.65]|eukprot:XP_012211023.1 hypothetical protein SPRG_15478 [Saprolegnia parasitica CBS 223.65]